MPASGAKTIICADPHLMVDSVSHRKQTPTGGARRKPTQSSNHTSNANNANNAITTSPELGSKSRDTETYNPVNSFNSQDVINHFDRSKAEMYKGAETMAWGSKVAPKGSTSTGADFLAELNRKQPVAP
ncbi:hypothetical protein KI688_004957 [Linnemannia hyalina]|uniref:Uncharacterized protein n=1 Tax=Linnemannia hyalina TaxID=64524 RepID=A0A9P7XM57_9FUNG|nr:hypothetical protein KI688_004957 [Linnemannia hyalina]